MKSSPYENNPYTSSSEAPTQPLPRLLPCLQAAGRPSWPYSWRCWPPSQPTASCTVAWPWAALWESSGIFTVTALYLLIKSKHFGWYPLSCLAFSLILVASFARSSRLCKILPAASGSHRLFSGPQSNRLGSLYPAGRLRSLNGAGRAPVPCPLSTDLPPLCAVSL